MGRRKGRNVTPSTLIRIREMDDDAHDDDNDDDDINDNNNEDGN